MEIDINRPRIVESHDVTLDAEYAEWIAEVKHSEIQMLENQYSIKLHQLGAELDASKLHQAGKEFPLPFALVLWRHHIEMIPMLEYMKQTIATEPHFDDHGYGVSPKPHEIDLRWDLPQGRVGMTWDGFNNAYKTDCVSITLRDRDFLQAVEDKESYGYSHYEDID